MTGQGGGEGEAGFTALVIEDEPLIALDTEEMLRDLGASEVRIVDEFGAAQAELDDCRFGVVLFDLDLGGVSTAALARAYLDLGCNAIVVSGADDALADFEGQNVRTLSKPVTAVALRGALSETGIPLAR